MSTTTIKPTIGRIVYYRGEDGQIRAAIITQVNGDLNLNLHVFPLGFTAADCCTKENVTHADPEQEPGCFPSWHWMPYQKQQAEKHANETKTYADGTKATGPAPLPDVSPVDTSDAAIEQQIQAKGKTAPRVTPADIEANIADERYFTAWEGAQLAYWSDSDPSNPKPDDGAPDPTGPLPLLTFCVLVLQNGFTVTGESACVSPENFDAGIGRQMAFQNAVQKIWPLMGYALKQELHEAANAKVQPAPGAAHPGYSTLQPHQQRVVDEKYQVDARLAKLTPFFDTPTFAGLAEEEKQRLVHQEAAMQEYSTILGERIAAFVAADV